MRVADRLQDHLSYPPRGLRLERAAAYVGFSKTTFLTLVAEGKMPQPAKVGGCTVWDRWALDAAFEALFVPSDTEVPDAPKRRNTFEEAVERMRKET